MTVDDRMLGLSFFYCASLDFLFLSFSLHFCVNALLSCEQLGFPTNSISGVTIDDRIGDGEKSSQKKNASNDHLA